MLKTPQEYLFLAEQAERAAMEASGKIAKRFLLMAATEYRQLAAEAVKLEKPKNAS